MLAQPIAIASLAVSYRNGTVILDDADRDRTIRVRFRRPATIPAIDALRPQAVRDTYLRDGIGAVRARFGRHAQVEAH